MTDIKEKNRLVRNLNCLADEFNEEYAALEDRYYSNLNKLTKAWLEKNRKYPNGFTFPYGDETAEITGANVNGIHGKREQNGYIDISQVDEQGVYIFYTCYVPSWCESDILNFGRIGNKPDTGVHITEEAITIIIEKNRIKKYNIPVKWESAAIITVEASSLNEALEKVYDEEVPRSDATLINFEVDTENIKWHNEND